MINNFIKSHQPNLLSYAIGSSFIALTINLGFDVINPKLVNAASLGLDIRPIQVCDDFGSSCAPIATFEAETRKIWEQADIEINFLPAAQFNDASFLEIDDRDEFNELVNNFDFIQNENPQTINAWFVNRLDSRPGRVTFGRVNRIGGQSLAINSPSVLNFNRGVGRLDTFAHEIGHNLGLTHDDFGAGGEENVLSRGSDRNPPGSINDIFPDGDGLSFLTDEQIAVARSSEYVYEILDPIINPNEAILPNPTDILDSSIDPISLSPEFTSISESAVDSDTASVPEPSAIFGLLTMVMASLFIKKRQVVSTGKITRLPGIM